jgi:hypothetical protein
MTVKDKQLSQRTSGTGHYVQPAKFIGELLKNSLASKHTATLIQKAFLDIFPALEYGDGSAKH